MKRISTLLMAAALAVPACAGTGDSSSSDPGDPADPNDPGGTPDEYAQQLNQRVTDYGAALRIAALRLTGTLPKSQELVDIVDLPDPAAQKAAYEARIDEYMARVEFNRQIFFFWQDTFKTGNDTGASPEFDTAAALAAQLSIENGAYTNLFTQTTGLCPTFDTNAGTVTAAECAGNNPKAGVLANPGIMKNYNGNLAFRRVRFVQETFDCTKFPVAAELAGPPQDVGAQSPYTGVWKFDSVAGSLNGGRVDFHDVSAVICMNCHQTINHLAPLFANFDANGAFQNTIQVLTPLNGAPKAAATDFLPAGEPTAWRLGVATPDLPALGAAMAADPSVAKCGVARIWNWALGKQDIVDVLAEVPAETIQGQVDAFTANGFKLKDMIRSVFVSDDFTKF